MVILGLGSNVGDRLTHLRKALNQLRLIPEIKIKHVSPLYLSDALLPDNAPPDWDLPHLNLAIACETTLTPFALLDKLKEIEWSIGRKPEVRHWGPRILDIDILTFDDQIISTERLTVPRDNVLERPFALWPLADLAPLWIYPLPGKFQGQTAAQIAEQWGSRFSGKAPFRTKQINQRIDTPELVGIVNLTPDSFSDGGCYVEIEKAFEHAKHLVTAGASILDIGAESTAPSAQAIDSETEWRRLQPFLQLLRRRQDEFLIPPKISIDTRHADVAERALSYHVDWINDVSGLDDPKMREIVASTGVDCVIMHHLHIPERRQHIIKRTENPVTTVYQWGESRINTLLREGIKSEQIIFDPGIGFGKMAEQSLVVLQSIEKFAESGVRVLVGHSRKTFFSTFTPASFAERDVETTAIALALRKKRINYFRLHQVEMCARSFKAACFFDDK